MAALDGANKPRDALPSIRHLHLEQGSVAMSDPYRHPAAAGLSVSTAPLASPTSIYSAPPPPYSTNESSAPPAPAPSGYISPPESAQRQSRDDQDSPGTSLSLPSIHEALGTKSIARPSATPLAQSSASAPTSGVASSLADAPTGPVNPFSQPLGSTSHRDSIFSSNGISPRSQPNSQHLRAMYPANGASPKEPPNSQHLRAMYPANGISPKEPPNSQHLRAMYPVNGISPKDQPNTQHLRAMYPSSPSDPHPLTQESRHPHSPVPGPPPSHGQSTPRSNPFSSHFTENYDATSVKSPTSQQHQRSSFHAHTPYTESPPAGFRHSNGVSQRGQSRSSYDENSGAFPHNSTNQAYGESIKRHLDVYDTEIAFSEIHEASTRTVDFCRHWSQRVHQNSRTSYLPEPLPELHEVDDLMMRTQRVLESFARMREAVIAQQTALAEERARPPGSQHLHSYGPDDYKLDGNFGSSDAKKRRGKAAPPGRCHSCNRAETPEWRRGPDGARTLCNACGLHYAKLTRKVGVNKAAQMTASNLSKPPQMPGSSSNLRPKGLDPRSPPL